MKCKFSEQDWLEYILDRMDEPHQKQMVQHLTICTSCMSKYEKALSASLPSLEQKYGNAPDLSNTILSVIEHQSQHDHPAQEKQIRLSKSALIHYGIAASLALLLYRAGIFDHLFLYADQSHLVAKQSNEWFYMARTSTMQWFSKLSYILNKSF